MKIKATAFTLAGKNPSGSQINKAASRAFALEPQDVRVKFGDLAKAVPKGVKSKLVTKKRNVSTETSPDVGSTPQAGSAPQAGTAEQAGSAPDARTARPVEGAAPMLETGPSAALGTQGTTVGSSVAVVGGGSEQFISPTVTPLQDSARPLYPVAFNFCAPRSRTVANTQML